MGQAGKRTRHNRTITVDFQNEATYFQLLGDGKGFVECVMAFLLVTLSERRRRLRFLACFSCGAVVGVVAVSRIYLDMHWLSDVIPGALLGSGTALACPALLVDLRVRAEARAEARRGGSSRE